MTALLATLNAGSSSLKFAVFSLPSLQRRLSGQIAGIGSSLSVHAYDVDGAEIAGPDLSALAASTHEEMLGPFLGWLYDRLKPEGRLVAVGHRIVHGGTTFHGAVLLDEEVIAAVEALCSLAPLHQPQGLAGVRAVRTAYPHLTQVACFDTAFHCTLPGVATRFALPQRWYEAGVRRYGFHGLSYDSVVEQLRGADSRLAEGKVIAAHLGSGASLCAIRGGHSLDTTMGFTALDGLMMGTRCGALDPGVVLYLQQRAGLSVQEVERLLYQQSGLLGVSGLSSDMRALLASDDPRAQQAIELFTYRITREAGGLAAVLQGLDAIVFTGGIGENSPQVRESVAQRLAWLGVELDPKANLEGTGLVSTPSSRVAVWVFKTDEEAVIARHTAMCVQDHPSTRISPAE